MNYNDMMRTVAGATGLTRRQADEFLVSTLTVLAEVVSADETRDLLAQLPKSFRDRVPVTGERITMRPIEFVARVGDLLTAPAPTESVEHRVRAVFAVLVDAVNAGEMNDIADELGDEYTDLLGRTERVEREERQAQARIEAAVSDPVPAMQPPPAPRADATLVQTVSGLVVHAVAVAAEVALVAVRTPVDAGMRIANSLRH